MKDIFRIEAVIFLALVSGCAGRLIPHFMRSPTETYIEYPDNGYKITLLRKGCYGTCPGYVVHILSNGEVYYEGFICVKKIGKAEGNASTKRIEALRREFDKVGFWSFRRTYSEIEDGCKSISTDASSAGLVVETKKGIKMVGHYHGCYGLPISETLRRLEDMVDEVAGTEKWIGEEKEKINCKP